MKKDELPTPDDASPSLEQTPKLFPLEPGKQDVPPQESLDEEETLPRLRAVKVQPAIDEEETLPRLRAVKVQPAIDEEETLSRLRAVKVRSATHDHSSLGGTMIAVPPRVDSDMVDEPIEVEQTKNPRSSGTFPLPALQLRYITPKNANGGLRTQVETHSVNRNAPKVSPWQWVKASLFTDKWLIALLISVCLASGLSLWYFFAVQQTLLYRDANAHLLIARRVVDNLTPGLAQLGGIWLPLPHLLMLPLVWNDFLWRTGLAGSIVSMLCYIIAAVYIFLSARRLTSNSLASFIGTLVFVLNPNILYLQTTPLSELVLIATLAAACYYFVVWAQTDAPKYLIFTAGTTFLTTLARYDGWFLFATILVLIVLIGLVRHHGWPRIEANMILFGSMGSPGIVLWFVWNWLIFGDPLYFQHGPFSAQAQQKTLISFHLLYTYHDLFQSIRYYLIDCIDIVGPLLFGIGVLALLVFLMRHRLKPETFAALTFLSPIPFYIISLYTGQASLYLPTAVPGSSIHTLFNARYGEVVVMPIAIFLACLLHFVSPSQQKSSPPHISIRNPGRIVRRYGFPLLCLALIVGQSVWIASTGIITLQDGEYGLACIPTSRIAIYLALHYNGGRILEDLYTAKIDTLESTAGIDFKDMVYEGSGQLWTEGLSRPQSVVDWIIVNPTNPDDIIAKNINLTSPAFTSHFSFVVQEENGLMLYHRNGLPPLPTYTVPHNVLTEHQLCGQSNPNQFGTLPASSGKDTLIEQ